MRETAKTEQFNVAVYMRLPRKERAWIYCRVAAPEASMLKLQQEELKTYAENQMFEVVGATAEHGTGLSLMRDSLAEISQAAEQGLMDVLLVTNISMLGRNAQEVWKYVRQLKNNGVRVACMDRLM